MVDTDIRAVIFDMDGILVDSEPVYDELFKNWMRDNIGEVDDSVYEKVLGKTWQIVFEFMNENYDIEIDPTKEAEAMTQVIVEQIMDPGIPLRHGVERALKKLGEKYTLAVVSSSPRQVVDRMLLHHQIRDAFTHVTAVEDVKHPKPHPQPYAMTMLALGVGPHESIVVEDSLTGAEAGSAAGAFVYALPDPRFSIEKYQKFGKVIYDFDSLLEDLL